MSASAPSEARQARRRARSASPNGDKREELEQKHTHRFRDAVNIFGPAGGHTPYCAVCGRLGLLIELERLTGVAMPDIRYDETRGLIPRDESEAA